MHLATKGCATAGTFILNLLYTPAQQLLLSYALHILYCRSLLERNELVNIRWELWEVSILLLAFVIAQFAYYACLPYLLRMASATALNLSLLAADYYTVVAGMVFFNYKVNSLNFSQRLLLFGIRWYIL